MDQMSYKKGDIIFRQGDSAETMFDILGGRVGIYLDYGTEREKKLAELKSSDFFGEMGLIDHAPRSATAVALENRTRVREITEDELGALFRERPAKVLLMMQQLSARLRALTDDYMDACRTAADVARMEEKPDAVSAEDAEDISDRAARFAEEAQTCGAAL